MKKQAGIEVQAALVASSRARQGQGRPRHAGIYLKISSYAVRKASSCSLRSTNPSDKGHVRLPVQKTSRSAVPLLHFTKRSARGGALGASTGPRKALTWQAAVLHRWKASSGRVPADRTSARYDCRDNASFPTDTACYIPLPFICR